MAEPPETVYVPPGSTATAVGPSFIVHELRMDELLVKARSADGLRARLLESADDLESVRDELVALKALRDEDTETIIDLNNRLAKSEADRIKAVRQRNALVTTTSSVISLAIAAIYLQSRMK